MAARVSTLKKFFPVEAAPVVAPVTAAAILFTWMFGRTLFADPDGHSTARAGISGIDDKTAAQRGESWRTSIRNHFHTRIANNDVSIFPNKV